MCSAPFFIWARQWQIRNRCFSNISNICCTHFQHFVPTVSRALQKHVKTSKTTQQMKDIQETIKKTSTTMSKHVNIFCFKVSSLGPQKSILSVSSIVPHHVLTCANSRGPDLEQSAPKIMWKGSLSVELWAVHSENINLHNKSNQTRRL